MSPEAWWMGCSRGMVEQQASSIPFWGSFCGSCPFPIIHFPFCYLFCPLFLNLQLKWAALTKWLHSVLKDKGRQRKRGVGVRAGEPSHCEALGCAFHRCSLIWYSPRQPDNKISSLFYRWGPGSSERAPGLSQLLRSRHGAGLFVTVCPPLPHPMPSDTCSSSGYMSKVMILA